MDRGGIPRLFPREVGWGWGWVFVVIAALKWGHWLFRSRFLCARRLCFRSRGRRRRFGHFVGLFD